MSERCTRFEAEGLAQLEEGVALNPHFDTCSDCTATRAAYARIAEELARPREVTPPAGWEARVFEHVAARRHRRHPRRMRGLAVAAVIACVVSAPFLFRKGGAPADARLSLSVDVVADPSSHLRGQSARPGDTLSLTAAVPQAGTAELRVWREPGELVLRCPGAAECRREGGRLTAALKLPAVGRYQSLVVSSTGPLSPPLPHFSDDAAALLNSGAKVEVAEPIDVY